MGRIVEGLWDCMYCGTKEIRGGIRECPNCGKPRDNTTKFYMPNQINYVKRETAERISKNPDWVCIYCNGLNSADNVECKYCGSKRNSENLDYFSSKNFEENNSVNIPDTEEKTEYEYTENESRENLFNTTKIANSKSVSFKELLKHFLIPVMSVILIVGLIVFLIPSNEEITISNFYWERSIAIEKYQTVNENDWNLPSEARLLYTRQELYTYERVLDHYETKSRQVEHTRISGYEEYVVGYKDLGNGYFEEITESRPVTETYYETEIYEEPVYRQEPVNRTKYYYEIDKWLYERSVNTCGFDQKPYWGDLSSISSDERTSTKTETFYILGTNTEGKERKISISYDTWEKLEINQSVKLRVSRLGYGELIE